MTYIRKSRIYEIAVAAEMDNYHRILCLSLQIHHEDGFKTGILLGSDCFCTSKTKTSQGELHDSVSKNKTFCLKQLE